MNIDKPIYLVMMLMGIITCACGRSVNDSSLLEAERLANNKPDSARRILNDVNPDRLDNDDERMLLRLLKLEVADKLYEPHTDDKEVKALIEYFITGDNLQRVHPTVFYYAGRVYYDLGEDAKAMGYFKKSLRMIKREGNPDMEERIYAQLGYICSDHRLYNHSKRYIRKAVELSESRRDTVNLIGLKLNLADIHISKEEPDSAGLIYRGLEKMVKECNDSVTRTTYYTQLAIYYYYYVSKEKADSLLNSLALSYDKDSKRAVFCIRDKIRRGARGEKIDEDFYKTMINDPDPSLRFMAAKNLATAAGERGDGAVMLQYAKKAFEEMKVVQKRFNNSTIVEMEKIIGDTELENENLELVIENNHTRFILMSVLVLSLIIAGGAAIFIIRGRYKRTVLALEIERLKRENLRTVMELEAKIKELKELEDSNGIKEIGGVENLKHRLLLAKETDEMMRLFEKGDMAASEENFVRLREALRHNYPAFIAALDRMNLKQRDYHDAMMIKIKAPQKMCAKYFGVSPQSLANSRKRLFEKWCQGSGFKNWKEYVESL
ncbi:MAG: hypothetical protein K2J82_07385 [Muribaculaceae bacterium]|nr:hypothetical protein [Muribaculaceae bacterium]